MSTSTAGTGRDFSFRALEAFSLFTMFDASVICGCGSKQASEQDDVPNGEDRERALGSFRLPQQ